MIQYSLKGPSIRKEEWMKKQYTEMSEAIEDYVESTFHPEDEVLREIRERSEKTRASEHPTLSDRCAAS